MSKNIWLFGTRHDFHGLAPGWQADHVAAFIGRIEEIVKGLRPGSIGEESSEESVASFTRNAFGGSSALGQWCSSNKQTYLAFDPTDKESWQLGFPDSLTLINARNEAEPAVAQRIHDERFKGRELEWTRRINQSGETSWLLVIGAEHVQTMQERFVADGWEVGIVEANWTPVGISPN